jgi:thiosulfate dehydrogenase [quinone] large subunit
MDNAATLDTPLQRSLIVFFRLAVGWTFLYAGFTQIFVIPDWSAAGFLTHTKTFHAVMAPLAAPAILPYIDFLVKWGHLLIGLSLVSGLMMRVSGVFGILLMLTYWCAHLDFPYVSSPLNFILDEHIVDAALIVYLMAVRAGNIYGLDGWIKNFSVIEHNPFLRPLVR